MYQRKLERSALVWFTISVACFVVSLGTSGRSSAPFAWVVPLGTFGNACLWYVLWRERRNARDSAE